VKCTILGDLHQYSVAFKFSQYMVSYLVLVSWDSGLGVTVEGMGVQRVMLVEK
jgi:hypothetical protein